ncbi:sensor histidine kinase [Clostridium manihotivorum]|uniref:histidine kinase n=1 Tax=Clostridium manihotivorum TaxID=2320868 RepID=A0A3R5QV66_9CLOT|nr:HAMP domain-containing sensor histidine kinase [Clostridium manihotivorum]QAA33411.1 sensor histidine kinase [Clostridium manihotivorum]
MKFWTKTYFSVLLLFLLVFNISICYIMYTTYNSMIGSEKEKVLSEYSFIKQSLINDMDTLDSNGKLSNDTIKNLITYYSGYYSSEITSFLFLEDNKSIFSNLQYNLKTVPDSMLNTESSEKVALLSEKENKYILVSSAFDKDSKRYSLVYCYRIDRVMDTWRKLKINFIYFSFGISSALAIFLAILLNSSSKPLKKLTDFVVRIKSGDYDNKIEVKGRDEFALLGEQFNEMSEKISTTMQQLSSDMEMKQQFIDNLSHELRTPLTSIYGYADYIQKAAISEEDKYEATSFIMKESRRLQVMASRLLDMTIRRKVDIEKKRINLDELFEKVLKNISLTAKEKSISISVKNELYSILGDEDLIESLLINLLENALKASENNQTIELVGKNLNEKAIIEVIDHGKGIEAEHITHITEAFYRVDKARAKAEGGAGLGLTLCKQIMDMHHGELQVTSELNKGTTVILTFTTL